MYIVYGITTTCTSSQLVISGKMASSCLHLAVALIVLWQLVLSSCSHSDTEVRVASSCGLTNSDEASACVSIDDAMSTMTFGSDVILEPGRHLVTQSHDMRNLWNISISGATQTGVSIACEDGIGFSFTNVSGLIIANLTIDGCGLHGETLENRISTLNDHRYLVLDDV